ncbi:MAG: hypothetical protein ACE5H3_07585 [Planctomycetota bacterium]
MLALLFWLALFAPARGQAGFTGWEGRVSGPDGQAVPGARVRVVAGDRFEEAVTDEKGRFLLEWKAGSGAEAWEMEALAPGYSFQILRAIPPASPPKEISLILEAGIPVQVVAIGEESGKPVSGAELELWSGKPEHLSIARTDSSGRAVLVASEAGTAFLVSSGLGTTRYREVRFEVLSKKANAFEFSLAPFPRKIDLLALDSISHRPLGDAGFSVGELRPQPGRNSVVWRKYLPANGGHLVYAVPPRIGAMLVTVEAPGHYARQVLLDQPVEETAKILLEPFTLRDVSVYQGAAPLHAVVNLEAFYEPALTVLPSGAYEPNLPWLPPPFLQKIIQVEGECQGCFPFAAANSWDDVIREKRVPGRFFLRISLGGNLLREVGWVGLDKAPDSPWIFQVDPGRRVLEFVVRGSSGSPVEGAVVRTIGLQWQDPAGYDFNRIPMFESADCFWEEARTDPAGKVRKDLPACTILYWDVRRGEKLLEKGHIVDKLRLGGSRTILVVDHDG